MINTFLSVCHSPNLGALRCANRSTCLSWHSKLTVNLPVSFVTSLFRSRIITITRGVYITCLSFVLSPQLLDQSVLHYLHFHLLCFFDPEMCFVVPSLPSSPRFSYSPVTLISMCPEQYEWVSTPPCNTSSPEHGTPFLMTPPFTPFTPHPPPVVLTPIKPWPHCMLPACLHVCLIRWLIMHPPEKKQKNSPTVSSPSPSPPL